MTGGHEGLGVALLTLAGLAAHLRDTLAGDPRLGPVASRLHDLAADSLAEVAAQERSRQELRQLADLIRDLTRDDQRLALRTIRLRELVSVLLGDGPSEVDHVLRRDAYGREISL